jgi:hypothetical protein
VEAHMKEIDIALIKKRSLKGVVALTSQTFLLQVIAFASVLSFDALSAIIICHVKSVRFVRRYSLRVSML